MDANHDPLTHAIIGLAMKVHTALGPGLFESVYEAALLFELLEAGFDVRSQVGIPVVYRGRTLSENAFRADLIVEDRLIIELKSVRELGNLHRAQILNYMRLANIPKGLLINFNVQALRQGIKRFAL